MIENAKILNMYYSGDVANSIFLNGIEDLVLVDTGVKEKRDELLSEISKYNFKRLYVILTHPHADHIGNNYALKDKYNPIFIASINSKKLLEDYKYQVNNIIDKAPNFLDSNKFRKFYLGFLDKEVKIDVSFYKELDIDLGNRNLKIICVPGHTMGSIGIVDKKNKLLILSELLFKHSRKMIIYIEDYDKYVESLKNIKDIVEKESLECLITSHDEEPFSGNGKILSLVQFNLDYINKLSSSVKALYRKRYSVEEIAKELCKKYKKDYTLDSIVTVKSILNSNKLKNN